MDIFSAAIEAAKKNNISTIVAASTTGNTALGLFESLKSEKIRLIIVTHDEGRPPAQRRFNEERRLQLLANNVTVYTHNPKMILLQKVKGLILEKLGLPSWQRHLKEIREKYGSGIKVCYIIVQMLKEGRVLTDGRIVAIAGKKSGADSAAIFLVKPQSKEPILEEIIVKP